MMDRTNGMMWALVILTLMLAGGCATIERSPSAAAACAGCGQDPSEPAIPYRQFTLDNGLTLIVHQDHSAPLVAVNVWYHVGSRNEMPGRTGFAHLFEHLMYQGSEHYRDEYFGPFERVGATSMNGTTDNDRTNYFQTVPREALDLALWMESDRMAHLLGAIDQAKLDEQRAVVKNEKRQRENRPYGMVYQHIASLSFPEGHPYRWPVIGSMDDLDAASLEDVRAWFSQHYGAANAVLVVAGDVEPEQVRERVEHYFSAVPPGPPQLRQQRWIGARDTARHATLQDPAAQPRLYLVWNTPPFGDGAADRLDLLADLLAGDSAAMLDRELVQRRGLATRISAFQHSRELAGQFWIVADPAPGVTLAALQAATLEVLDKLASDGVDDASLERARTSYRADFLRGLQLLGGFGGRADVLAAGAIYTGDPGDYRRRLAAVATADSDTMQGLVRRWLDRGRLSLHVVPRPAYHSGSERADRSALPEVAAPADFELPPLQQTTLDNGLRLLLLHRPQWPLVELSLQLPAGHAYSATAPGLAGLVAALLAEGTERRDAASISGRLKQLGARFHARVDLDAAELQLSALSEHLDDSVALLAEIVRQPAFDDSVLQRIRQRRLADIARERNDPNGLASRLLGPLLLPTGHPYAQPLSGLGRPEVLADVDHRRLSEFHQRHYRPGGSALIAVGNTDMAALRQLAERYFGDWRNPAVPGSTTASPSTATSAFTVAASADTTSWPHPGPDTATVPSPVSGTIHLVDRPGASQTVIRAARLVPQDQSDGARRAALEIANAAFGGGFSSRLNLNLREDKGWSYGAYSYYQVHAGPDWLLVSTSVQGDRSGAALDEIRREWRQLNTATPLSQAERDRTATRLIRSRSGELSTLDAQRNEIARLLRLGLDTAALDDHDDRLRNADLERVRKAASQAFGAGPAIWLVIGDREQLRPQLEALPWVERLVEYEEDELENDPGPMPRED